MRAAILAGLAESMLASRQTSTSVQRKRKGLRRWRTCARRVACCSHLRTGVERLFTASAGPPVQCSGEYLQQPRGFTLLRTLSRSLWNKWQCLYLTCQANTRSILSQRNHHYHHRMKQTRFRGTVQAQCIVYDTIQLTIKHFIDQSHPQLATLQPDLLQSQLVWNASVPPLQRNVSVYVMVQDRLYIPASFSLSISATMASIWAKSRLCRANKSKNTEPST